MITRPLLAGKIEELEKINFPVYATPKLDGIRVLKVDGQVVTRKFKELPNRFVRAKLEEMLPDGIDGEVMLRGSDNFNEIQSKIMRFEGAPDFTFNAFDYVKDDLNKGYLNRISDLEEWYNSRPGKPDNFYGTIFLVKPVVQTTLEGLIKYEDKCLSEGYEGIMIRSAEGKYKCGRSTLREGILLKIKRFLDAEAEIIGFEEKLSNQNEQEKDEFGLAKRSSKKEGMVPTDTLGALIVKDLATGVIFNIGSGFTDSDRSTIWSHRNFYMGNYVKYKYQEMGKEAPRFPVFIGFRSPDDM